MGRGGGGGGKGGKEEEIDVASSSPWISKSVVLDRKSIMP